MKSRFKRKKANQTNLPVKTPVEIPNKRPVEQSKRIKTKSKKNGNGKNGKNGNGKLTAKQAKFVDEYLIDLNATQAAIRAGYSPKTADVIACQNLVKLNIQEAIAKRRNELSATARIDQEWVLKRYEMLSDYCIGDFYNDDGTMKPLSEIPKEKLYAIMGFKHSTKTIIKNDDMEVIDRIKEFKLPEKKGVLDSIRNQLGYEKNNKSAQGQGPTIIGQNIQVLLVDDSGKEVV